MATASNSHKKLGIKDWSEKDRPREKLISNGKEVLSDAELIAILLGSGTTDKSAVDVAKLLLNQANNSLNKLGKQTVKELCKVPGIGPAKAITIIAATELGRRRKGEVAQKEPIKTARQGFDYIYPYLADLDHERFYVILLKYCKAKQC